MTASPVLTYPKWEGMFILDTDASRYVSGAVLSQMLKNQDGTEVERPIAYFSRNFSAAERKYCARRRKMLAIILSVKHFNVYLRGQFFLFRTDHVSL